MSKKVYGLKHATPKMKYNHMKMVLEWRADLKHKQEEYSGEGNCPLCNKPIDRRPLFMVGVYDMCYSCFDDLKAAGITPPKHALDLLDSPEFKALPKDNSTRILIVAGKIPASVRDKEAVCQGRQ